jgi:nucleotide-binding universal stress UspA family protein
VTFGSRSNGNRRGRRALIQGAELAQQLGAETHLLAIVPSNDGSMVDPSEAGMREQEQQIMEVLREGVERLRGRGLTATGHLAFGHAVDQSPKVARDLGVDLIVIGYRPKSSIARWWAGPGKSELLDRVHCSILASILAVPIGELLLSFRFWARQITLVRLRVTPVELCSTNR